MIVALDHVAVAVTDFERAIERFSHDFGLPCTGKEDVTAAKTKTASFSLSGTEIELVHPLDGEGPIAKYLSSGKKGLHHLCFRTDDIDADQKRLSGLGYRFLTEAARPGANGSRVIFIDPKCCDGVLVELCQRADNATDGKGGVDE
ncbi:MAG: methylmalonyl-CoA epimerase [Aureliella sp.]